MRWLSGVRGGLLSGRLSGRLPCIVMIGVYDSLYRWPKGSPCESGAKDKRTREKGKRLAEVYAAVLFLYGHNDIAVEVADLFDEALAVDIAKLRERCERLLAVHDPDRETVRIGLRRGREWKRQQW